jgi:hypothetical protein
VIHSSDKPDLILRHATAADLDRVKCLWHALYRHQFEHGMLLRRPDGAYEAWLKSTTPFPGQFASVVVAELNGKSSLSWPGATARCHSTLVPQPSGQSPKSLWTILTVVQVLAAGCLTSLWPDFASSRLLA